jgi:hypothetical protein
MLNSTLTIQHHTSFISLHNPTTYSCSVPKGIILGTTTIPTLSFRKNSTIDHQLVNKNITKLVQHVNNPVQQN